MSHKKGLSLKIKSFVGILLMSVVFCAAAVAASTYVFSDTNESLFKKQAENIAYTAAANADAENIKKITDMVLETFKTVKDDEIVTSDDWGSPEFEMFLKRFEWITKTPEYDSVLNYLRNIYNKNIDTLSSIYLMVYDNSHDKPYAIYLAVASDEYTCVPGVIDSFNEDDDFNVIEHPEIGIKSYITNTEEYGWLVVAGTPVFDSNNNYTALMCTDLSMDDIKTKENSFFITLTVFLAVLAVLICIITLTIITFNVIHPINKLSDIAIDYIRNNKNKKTFASLKMERADEIGNLFAAMKKMESDITDYVNNLTIMTGEKERIKAELSIATMIQNDMMPKNFPDRSDLFIYGSMTPAKEVGGDFYDFFMIDKDHIGLVIADVSGKGIPASLFTVITKTLIKNHALSEGDPAKILEDVNNQLCENNEAGLFVTVWLGIFEI